VLLIIISAFFQVVISCVVLQNGVFAKSIDKRSEAEVIKTNSFSPSHQVFFRRSDGGELLLPGHAPFSGQLQQSSSNSINNYNNRPSYGVKPSYGVQQPSYGAPQQPEPEPACLLRTCDQVITGRDMTYQRALEIVQTEEYLVAVDPDLIRRRQDYDGG
jgi:hypothetical protein